MMNEREPHHERDPLPHRGGVFGGRPAKHPHAGAAVFRPDRADDGPADRRLGIYAMLQMPSGIYPEVAFPRIVVIAQTPGLAVKDVEMAVTRPIEEAVEHRAGRAASAVEVDARGGGDLRSISRPAPTWSRP